MEGRKTDPEWEAAFAKLSGTHPEIRPRREVDLEAVERADRAAGRSLVLGLISIPTVVLLGLGGLLGLIAVVLGFRAIGGQTKHTGRAGVGIAAGLIAIVTVIGVVVWLASEPLGACPYC